MNAKMNSTLSRAFTTKRAAKPADISTMMPKRSFTTKVTSGTIRNKISAPVELISTTNMLSYNAPDIYPSSNASNSGDDSDRSLHGVSTPLTSPDTSSIECSPTSASPEPNHLSCYFGNTSRQSSSSDEAPVIPKRAVSHTKKNAEAVARKRSISRLSSSKNSISSVLSSPKSSISHTRSSLNMFSANVDSDHHPFGNELAQVSEIAEEYGITEENMTIVDQEEQELRSLGLFKFCAEEYMSEIQGLFLSAFVDSKPRMAAVWI